MYKYNIGDLVRVKRARHSTHAHTGLPLVELDVIFPIRERSTLFWSDGPSYWVYDNDNNRYHAMESDLELVFSK